MSVSPTDDDEYCVHHSCGNRSSFQAAFLMMANEMKLICERKKVEAEKEKEIVMLRLCGNEEESSGKQDIDYVQDRNKETTANKSGSSLLPKNVDCRLQNCVQTLFVCFNPVSLSVLLIPCFAYIFAHLSHFDVCFSDFGHFVLSEGVMHILEGSMPLRICTPVYSWMVEKNHDDCRDGLNLLPIFDFLFAM